jgi:hypothetical protein
MKRKSVNVLSDEVLAAYLDGNASPQQSLEVVNLLSDDSDLRELFYISQKVDAELGLAPVECELLPMTALAATCSEDSYCALECEKYLLNHFDIEFDEAQLLEKAVQNGWQKEDGTALHNVGRHLEEKGLVVSRRYKCSLDDIVEALGIGCYWVEPGIIILSADESAYSMLYVNGGIDNIFNAFEMQYQ